MPDEKKHIEPLSTPVEAGPRPIAAGPLGDRDAVAINKASPGARDHPRLECPFGPEFFLTQLNALVRDRCPDASERLPAVGLHLPDGTILGVCHVIDLTPSWVVLAVDDREIAGVASMRTELVPYKQIMRVTIRTIASDGVHVGFTQSTHTIVREDCHGPHRSEPLPPPI